MRTKTNLEQGLARYGVMAQGQIARGHSLGEIAGYAAAVGASLAMAGSADAAIIYSGVQDVTLSIKSTLGHTITSGGAHYSVKATSSGAMTYYAVAPLDINGDGTPDLAMAAIVGAGNTGGGKYGIGLAGLAPINSASAKLLMSSRALVSTTANHNTNPFSTTNPIFQALAGANVPGSHSVGSSGQSFAGSGKYFAGLLAEEPTSTNPYVTANVNVGNFALGVTGVAGFQLGNGDYGWIRLLIQDTRQNNPLGGSLGLGLPDQITAVDWAYNTVPGDPIHVPRPIPEPDTLALLAAGALGLAAFRRRKAARGR